MTPLEHITGSLQQLAEADIDLVPSVYARFFARCPEARPLFASREAQAVQGRMVNELVQTVLDRLEGREYSRTLVTTMVSDHNGWGVTLAMYDAFLAAFLESLQEAIGDQPAIIAWRRELGALREEIAGQLFSG